MATTDFAIRATKAVLRLIARTAAAALLTGVASAPAGETTVDLAAVRSLLASRCLQCHGPDKQEGGLRLDTRGSALAGGDSGPALVPGDADASLLLQAVRQMHESLAMPPKEKLKSTEIALLTQWVKAGAAWPVFPRAMPPASGDTAERIGDAWADPANPVVQRFGGERLDLWSLKRPALAEVPAVRQSAWCRTPVDYFLLARMEAGGVQPSAEADRRTLIRRIYFDLWGLPPTPEAVRAFLADPAPDAYEQLIDRLLDDPHYGERWARYWLDIVRYADSNGCERDEFRPMAYRYRDYVIRSFNADTPYDEFIRQQLAGDELVAGLPETDADADRLIATGFLRNGPFDSTAPIFQEEARARDQLMADLVNTTCSAFLGLTIGCANCHDHKYDPLLQTDHFRLRAFFAAVRFRDDLPIDLAPAQTEIIEHNAAIDRDLAGNKGQLDALLEPVRASIVAQRKAGFPDDIQQLLALDPSARDADSQEKLKPYEQQLIVKSEELDRALSDVQRATRDELIAKADKLGQSKRQFTTAVTMADDGSQAPATFVFFQGDHTNPQQEVQPGVPAIFDPNPLPIEAPRAATTGRRLALANWIASPDNPLTARVMVNRIWQHHFGVPIVATPSDFGFSGVRPTHPELLDWLALDFVDAGWSIKHVHRLLLRSSAYRQSSAVESSSATEDPDNHWLWRQNLQRLDAEATRDAMLAASGRLLPYHEGKPLWPSVPQDILLAQPGILEEKKGDNAGRPQGWYTDPEKLTDARTIFLIQKRSVPLPLLQVFDVPDSAVSCARRDVTTIAPQALNLLNSDFAIRMAQAMAARLRAEVGPSETLQIDRAVWLALGRDPSDAEREALMKLLRENNAHYAGRPEDPGDGLADICRALMNTNEFVYID